LNLLSYQSDVDISSGTSSSGRSFSSPSTEDVTPSPPAADGDAQPATFEKTAAQLDLFGLNLPSPQQQSQDDTSPDIEVIQYNGDLETMRDIGLFGGGESWVRPPASSPTPTLPSQTSQPFDLARLLTADGDGTQGNFSNSSNNAIADYSAGPSASTSYGNTQTNMVPLEFAWTLAQVMSKGQAMNALTAMHTGQISPASMQGLISPNPMMDSRLNVKVVAFATAMQINLVTLGYLLEDADKCDANAVADVWKKRSARYLRRGPDGRYADNVEDPTGKLVLSFPNVRTELSKQQYCGVIPSRLSRDDQCQRIRRLRNAPNIHPTKLQLNVPHSLFIDVLPWPSVRDRLIHLTTSGVLDMHTVKMDLVGKLFGCTGAGNTLVIHGDDPLDEESWEMSEYFLQKYHPYVHFERKIIRRTNFWRRHRGEPDVNLEKCSEEFRPRAEQAAEMHSQSGEPPHSDTTGMPTMTADLLKDATATAAPSMSLPTMSYDLETTLEELLASHVGMDAGVAR
jgi:hypothetical protein